MGIVVITAYFITFYIRPQDWVPFFLGLPVNDVIVGGGLLAGLVSLQSSGRKINLPQNYLIVVVLMIIFLSNAVHGDIVLAFEVFMTYLKRACVFLMFLLVLDSVKKIKWALFLMILFGAILAVQGIQQAQTGIGWAGQPLTAGYTEIRIRWIGDWDGPNVLAILFVLGFSMSLEFILSRSESTAFRILNVILALLLLVGLHFTNSRGGVLALLCAILFYFTNKYRRVFATLCGAVLVLLVVLLSPSRMSEVNTREESARERTWTWEQGLNILRENPILGIGKGQLIKYMDPPLIAHNNYVQVFSEMGLLGFYFWLGIFYYSVKGLYQILQRKPETKEQAEIISLANLMLSALIGFSAATFFVTMELDILYVLWALCAAVILMAQSHFPDFRVIVSKLDMGIIGGGMFGIIIVIYLIVR